MRVVHVSCVAPPAIGGIGKVAADEVVALRAHGIDARLIAPEPAEGNPKAERSFIELVKPSWRFGNASWLPGIDRRVKDADVVHLHYPFFGTAEPLLLAAGPLPPVVVTFHMDATDPGLKGLAFGLHRMLVQPWLFRHAAAVLVSSFDYARQSSLRNWSATHAARVHELPFAVDGEFFSPGPARRERFAVPPEASVIAFAGGLDQAHAFKGIRELLQAFARLAGEPHLLIVGEGDLRPSYEEEARTIGIDRRTHFLGRVDRETLRDVLRSADIFAFPSTNAAEAFGLAALEAEACGTPVIASDLPGVRTVVRHGETGLLVPPKDVAALAAAMNNLLADIPTRRAMGQNARNMAVERFSWDRHIDGLMEVYRSVCASPS